VVDFNALPSLLGLLLVSNDFLHAFLFEFAQRMLWLVFKEADEFNELSGWEFFLGPCSPNHDLPKRVVFLYCSVELEDYLKRIVIRIHAFQQNISQIFSEAGIDQIYGP